MSQPPRYCRDFFESRSHRDLGGRRARPPEPPVSDQNYVPMMVKYAQGRAQQPASISNEEIQTAIERERAKLATERFAIRLGLWCALAVLVILACSAVGQAACEAERTTPHEIY